MKHTQICAHLCENMRKEYGNVRNVDYFDDEKNETMVDFYKNTIFLTRRKM